MQPGSWNYLLRVAHFYIGLVATKWAEWQGATQNHAIEA